MPANAWTEHDLKCWMRPDAHRQTCRRWCEILL